MASSASQSRKNDSRRSNAQTKTQKKTNERNIVQTTQDSALKNEIILIVIFAVTILLFLCNFGLIGVVGDAVSGVMFGVFGLIAYIVPVMAFVAIAFGISNQGNVVAVRKLCAGIILFLLLGILFELFAGKISVMDEYSVKSFYETGANDRIGGGVISGSLAWVLHHFLGMVGTVLTVLVLGIICAVIITEKSFVSGVKKQSRRVYETARSDAQFKKERRIKEAEVRKGEAALRREEALAVRRQQADQRLKEREQLLREREQKFKEEQARQDAEHILRMDKKVSGVMMDTSLKESTAKKMRDDIHEITLDESETQDMPMDEPEVRHAAPIGDPSIDFDKIRIRTMHQQTMQEYIPQNEPDTYSEAENEKAADSYDEDVVEGLEALPKTAADTVETIYVEEADVFSDMKEVRWQQMEEYAADISDEEDEFTQEEQEARDVLRELNRSNIREITDRRPKAVIPREQRPQTAAEATPLGQEMLRKERLEKKTSIFADDSVSRNRETSAGHQFKDNRTQQQKSAQTPEPAPKPAPRPYQFPPLDLLKKVGNADGADGVRELKENAVRLQQILESFNVRVTIKDVSQGPSVTRYELLPEQGMKVSRIVGLADEIKLYMETPDIRIEAPIPGKAAVGIEIPNKSRIPVGMRELLESREFKESSSKLSFTVGKDIGGKVIVSDIAKMPHMLIAGTTGSGKSVFINSIIMSILYNAKPTEVKLILVDPKVVEMNVYNGIPHLLIPVVSDPKKASAALQWAVAEMTDRYKKFADHNVRDLKGYNKKVEQLEQKGEADCPEKMPQIVIVVDELADLMMVASNEVEESICRLAQLARAAGIHLIIATQRPSVDVITGLIKANMPSRVALKVSSGVDSRTILDMNGAEKLLGYGDMLFYPQGYTQPVRMQGAFLTDEEVADVVDFLKNQAIGNTYSNDIEERIKNMGTAALADTKEGGQSEYDSYFAEAGRFIIDKDKASIGMLQRVFKIGFNRAARIMDQLAMAGVVGEEEGTKPRKILMTMDEFEQLVEEII